jgi:hypothetical protein
MICLVFLVTVLQYILRCCLLVILEFAILFIVSFLTAITVRSALILFLELFMFLSSILRFDVHLFLCCAERVDTTVLIGV